MLNKIRQYFYYISYITKFNEFSHNMDIYGRKQMFDVEKFIQHEDKKRKSKMTADQLAKEVLLLDDCYIIKKDVLKQYFDKR